MHQFPPELLHQLRAAPTVAVLTGAGISAESGVPTFREAQTGLWAKYDPTELASPAAFARNPRLVWEWYAWRRSLVQQAQPNPGHYALAALEQHLTAQGGQFWLLTQNVDNLHQRAGSRQVLELHGNLQQTKCFTEDTVVETWPATDAVPPPCPRCGGFLRPAVVWFGEQLPQATLATAFTAAQQCQVFFSIGTSGLVEPAASLPHLALQRGAYVVEINPAPTPLTPQVTCALSGPAGQILPALMQAVWGAPSLTAF